jgi:hypothetical protein
VHIKAMPKEEARAVMVMMMTVVTVVNHCRCQGDHSQPNYQVSQR